MPGLRSSSPCKKPAFGMTDTNRYMRIVNKELNTALTTTHKSGGGLQACHAGWPGH